jgi:SAM-dependent methyltransferase
MFERFLVPVYLPRWVHVPITKLKRTFIPASPDPVLPPAINLLGDRDIEWSYIASRLPVGETQVLDFGCGNGNMSIHAIQKGHRVLALDLEDNFFPWSHPNLERMQGDLLEVELPESAFDFVLNCSTVEHVGLTGRYGVAVEESDGDIVVMRRLRKLLKPTGKMLMTIPCGRDAVIVPWHRIYGKERLAALLEGYHVDEESYWVKDADNRWHPSEREAALSYIPTGHPIVATYCSYALGCFVLS